MPPRWDLYSLKTDSSSLSFHEFGVVAPSKTFNLKDYKIIRPCLPNECIRPHTLRLLKSEKDKKRIFLKFENDEIKSQWLTLLTDMINVDNKWLI